MMDLGSQSGFVCQGTWGDASGGGNLELIVRRSYGDVTHCFQSRGAGPPAWHATGRVRVTQGRIGQVRSASVFEASPPDQGRRLYAAVRVFDGPDSAGRGHEDVRLVSRGGPPGWQWYTKGINVASDVYASSNCAALETSLPKQLPTVHLVVALANGGIQHLQRPYDGDTDQYGHPVWRASAQILGGKFIEALALLHRPGSTLLEVLARDSTGAFHYVAGDVASGDLLWLDPISMPDLPAQMSGATAHGIPAFTYTSDRSADGEAPEIALWAVTPFTYGGRSGGLAEAAGQIGGQGLQWEDWRLFDGPTDDLRWRFYTGGQVAPRNIAEVSLIPARTGPGEPLHLTHELSLRYVDVNSYEHPDDSYESVVVHSQRYWAVRPRGPHTIDLVQGYWWSPVTTAIAL